MRFLVAKATLPASLTQEPSAKDRVARTEIIGKDLAALEGRFAKKVSGASARNASESAKRSASGRGKTRLACLAAISSASIERLI